MKTRNNVVKLAQSWLGKNLSDGSYKDIIDIYNTYHPLPRGTKMQYDWPWCACTWSALAIKLGYTDIMPVEISCYYLIEHAKRMGIWVENDSYIPKSADAVLYDWDDSGSGDNTGVPDHIGIVESVGSNSFTVIEGNYSDSVKRRTINFNSKYIRGFICPKYDVNVSNDISSVIKDVLAGKYGNGTERKQRLEAAGYDYNVIQNAVNKACITNVAKDVINGKYGNGAERVRKLAAAGYDYEVVQKTVNELLSK